MLAGHPGIHSGPETHFFHCFRGLSAEYARSEGKWFGFSRYLDEQQFGEFLAETFWLLVSGGTEPAGPARFFLEKTPDHCLDGDAILHTFPNARFIHLIRDARSVAASLLRGSKGWAADWAPNTATDAAFMWAERVRAGQAIGERLGPERYLELRYEDLRSAPEDSVAGILRWLGLESLPELVETLVAENRLDRTIAEGTHFKNIPGFANLPAGFIGRAPASGEASGLSPEKRRLVEQVVAPELRALGYPVEAPQLEITPTGDETFAASVLVTGEGNDPGEIMDTLGQLSNMWQDGWELVLTNAHGEAARSAAGCLDGDYQFVDTEEAVPFGEALTRGAVAARGRELIVPTARGLFTLPRRELLQLGGFPHAVRDEAWAWIAWRGKPKCD
jgi:hypothetical protein